MTDKLTNTDRRARTLRAIRDSLRGRGPKHQGPPPFLGVENAGRAARQGAILDVDAALREPPKETP